MRNNLFGGLIISIEGLIFSIGENFFLLGRNFFFKLKITVGEAGLVDQEVVSPGS